MVKAQTVPGNLVHTVLAGLGYTIRQRPGGMPVVDINGTELVMPADSKKAVATDHFLTGCARAMGVDGGRKEMVEVFFGCATVKGGKPKAAVKQLPPAGVSRSDVLVKLAEVRSRVSDVERWLRAGAHDPVLYGRVFAALRDAGLALVGYPPDLTVGVDGPDDSGYRPTRYDPIATGVARATGLTRSAASSGQAITKWQHEERSA